MDPITLILTGLTVIERIQAIIKGPAATAIKEGRLMTQEEVDQAHAIYAEGRQDWLTAIGKES